MSKVAIAKSNLQEKMSKLTVHDEDSSQIKHVTKPPKLETIPRTTIDEVQLSGAISEGLKDSRFGAWSKPGKIALLYLANTTPRFSMSTEAAKHLEAGLERDYPELMHSIHLKLSSKNT